jgi:hypothetical protein
MTEMYEAVEALTSLATGRAQPDLAKDKELFLSKISAAAEFKLMLQGFIDYAQLFRHSPAIEKPRPAVT